MSTSPLSVQLYTVREALNADPRAAYERLSELGFTSVEPFGLVERFDQYSEFLPEFGFSAPSAHAALLGKDQAAIFEAARSLGVTTVIDPHIDREKWSTLDDVTASATALNAAGALAADYGLTVGYHNHWWELEHSIDGVPSLEVFASLLDPSLVIELDTYWSSVGGVDPVAFLDRLGQRAQFLHIKDGDISQDDKKQVAVGSGRMPVLDILAAAPHATRVIELDDFEGDVFDALADSISYLTANGESL